MSYYTEFEFNAVLKKNTPKEILDLLNRVVNDYYGWYKEIRGHEHPSISSVGDRPDFPIEHQFSKATRWNVVLTGEFNPIHRRLKLKTSINYGYEDIEDFLDWILPFISNRRNKRMIAWQRGEDIRERVYRFISYNKETNTNTLTN